MNYLITVLTIASILSFFYILSLDKKWIMNILMCLGVAIAIVLILIAVLQIYFNNQNQVNGFFETIFN